RLARRDRAVARELAGEPVGARVVDDHVVALVDLLGDPGDLDRRRGEVDLDGARVHEARVVLEVFRRVAQLVYALPDAHGRDGAVDARERSTVESVLQAPHTRSRVA